MNIKLAGYVGKAFITFLILQCGLILHTNGQANTPGSLMNLGSQVVEKSINGSTFIKDANGDLWVYTVERGSPARLLGYRFNAVTPEINLPLTGASGSWSIVASTDGQLYAASDASALLFKHTPGTQQVQALGNVLAGENYLWELAAGKNGEIFGSTYPGCKVFRYHPSNGFTEVSNGAASAGENYARSLVYHEPTDKLFVGVGSRTSLVKLDPRTGAKTEILPQQYRGHSGFVYYLGLINGISSGDKLLVTITGTTNHNKTLIYNINTNSYENELGVFVSKTAIKSPVNQNIYYTNASALYSYDLAEECAKQVNLNKNGSALATYWLSNNQLCFLTGDGKLITYNTTSKAATHIQLEIPAEPISINTLAYGPDGRIWMSGYPVGSNAAYNPSTGQTQMYYGLSQSESISKMANDIYFGVYSGAKFYKYNTQQPWVINTNPKNLGSITGQDRPFAYASVSSLNKMFFGTVPGYGRLGGAIVEYDVQTDNLSSTLNIIPDQSIVSLLYTNNELFGGTSVWGGLGITPTTTEAKLFILDPSTKTKLFEIVPVAGAKAITNLINGPDGNIWGMADGTLFVFNKTTRTVVSSHVLFTVSPQTQSTHVWKNAALINHPSGRVFGVCYGDFFELNPTTKQKTTITTNAYNALTMDEATGYLYFQYGLNLWRYIP
jgi:streptogramin lyase